MTQPVTDADVLRIMRKPRKLYHQRGPVDATDGAVEAARDNEAQSAIEHVTGVQWTRKQVRRA